MIKITSAQKGHLHIECSSDYEHLDRIVDEAEQFLSPLVTDDELAYKVVLLLSEAVTNAIEHGNAMDASKHVKSTLEVNSKTISIQVEDEGTGFDPKSLANPLESDNLLNDGGRGIFFIQEMADKVWFDKEGRRVHIEFNQSGS